MKIDITIDKNAKGFLSIKAGNGYDTGDKDHKLSTILLNSDEERVLRNELNRRKELGMASK